MVDLCSGRPVGVDGRFVGFLWFMEAEPVAPTVSGAVKLLEQEDHRLVDDSQHPQSIHTWEEQTKRIHDESFAYTTTYLFFFVLRCSHERCLTFKGELFESCVGASFLHLVSQGFPSLCKGTGS